MDKYAYLFISVLLFVPWLAFCLSRPDLKKKILKTSVLGGLAGLIAEFWYFRDYWQPPSLFGKATVSPEDFLFGFFITGIAVAGYDVAFRKTNATGAKKRKKFFAGLFATGVFSLFIFNNWMGFNSIFVSSLAFVAFSVVMSLFRKDLWLPSLISGMLTVLIIIPVYAIIFNLLYPDFWNKYGLLSGSAYGIAVLGHIPVTELVWYFSWGSMAGIAYDFASGKKKMTYQNKRYKY
ncbi:lycopene cyclase domain-containing protein [Sinomicrobium weinanense]|uniref:Lycopene cyclase domain-containing protein n=1 Tax=Sinomicrobium weinanense TaxID=2842200 RepID=A0A926JRE8_9FLAO|nr:lycopene cyclase domain-containing protein [Sinomicrobium weinanense]MBC9796115.1 hypothetical protein [Sinomicrobium weinanense]MBU3124784.1 hypothetical protein [Sinomicrobium weinanense]